MTRVPNQAVPEPRSFEEYVQAERSGLISGKKLMAPEQVMERLGITRKKLRSLCGGKGTSGVRLPVLRLGHKTLRFREADVLFLEWLALNNSPQ